MPEAAEIAIAVAGDSEVARLTRARGARDVSDGAIERGRVGSLEHHHREIELGNLEASDRAHGLGETRLVFGHARARPLVPVQRFRLDLLLARLDARTHRFVECGALALLRERGARTRAAIGDQTRAAEQSEGVLPRAQGGERHTGPRRGGAGGGRVGIANAAGVVASRWTRVSGSTALAD